MKALRLKETYTSYSNTRNVYGDEVLTPTGTGLCLFRNISSEDYAADMETATTEGIFWFAPTDPHVKGDVIGFNGQLYRLERITVARERLTTNAVHFYKCTASFLRQIS